MCQLRGGTQYFSIIAATKVLMVLVVTVNCVQTQNFSQQNPYLLSSITNNFVAGIFPDKIPSYCCDKRDHLTPTLLQLMLCQKKVTSRPTSYSWCFVVLDHLLAILLQLKLCQRQSSSSNPPAIKVFPRKPNFQSPLCSQCCANDSYFLTTLIQSMLSQKQPLFEHPSQLVLCLRQTFLTTLPLLRLYLAQQPIDHLVDHPFPGWSFNVQASVPATLLKSMLCCRQSSPDHYDSVTFLLIHHLSTTLLQLTVQSTPPPPHHYPQLKVYWSWKEALEHSITDSN